MDADLFFHLGLFPGYTYGVRRVSETYISLLIGRKKGCRSIQPSMYLYYLVNEMR